MDAKIEYKALKVFDSKTFNQVYIPYGWYNKKLREFLTEVELNEIIADFIGKDYLELKGDNKMAKLKRNGKDYFDKNYFKEQAYDLIDEALNKLNSGSGKGSIDTSHNRYQRIQQMAENYLEDYKLVKYEVPHQKWGSMVEIIENGYKVIEAGGIRNYLSQMGKEVEIILKPIAIKEFGSTVDLSENGIMDLIQKGESPVLEFKSTLRVNIKAGNTVDKKIEHSVLKTLAAFLNSEGGTLLIGIDDNKNVLGLELDFNSFTEGDKLDEFKKHFDNLIAKSLGNTFHRYLKVGFPHIDVKTICYITIKGKSEEPVYITNAEGQEAFYIRRQASTIELKPRELVKYIKEHWE